MSDVDATLARIDELADALADGLDDLEAMLADDDVPTLTGPQFQHLAETLAPIGERGRVILERDLARDLEASS
jgi:hypothetical protein